MSDTELLPCPFCGGKADLVTFASGRARVLCIGDDCLIESVSVQDTPEGAVTAWNSRRPPPGVETEGVGFGTLGIARQLVHSHALMVEHPDPIIRQTSEEIVEAIWQDGHSIMEIAHAYVMAMEALKAATADLDLLAGLLKKTSGATYTRGPLIDAALLSTSSRGEDLSSRGLTRASLPASDGIPSEWRPIEIAPKVEASVLLFAGDVIYIGYWSRRMDGWTEAMTDELFAARGQPTHWMPLPSAPAGSQASE